MLAFWIEEHSQVGAVRREVHRQCEALGFDETTTGRATLITTELGTNLIKHAGGGELIITPLTDPSPPSIELLCLDKGPGIHDLASALRDGYSTAGSMGTGLGAVRRLASVFDAYSRPELGTVILARV